MVYDCLAHLDAFGYLCVNKYRVALGMPGHLLLLLSFSIFPSLRSCASLSSVGIWGHCWRKPALDLAGWGLGVAQAQAKLV